MNMNSQDSLISVEEYFKILEKENLKPEELISKKSFEKYISLCKDYEDFLSPAAQSILNAYNSRVMNLNVKENKTAHEESVLTDFQSAFEATKEDLEQEGPVRRLAKSGYIDAAVILTILLNVGFIIAMTMLGR